MLQTLQFHGKCLAGGEVTIVSDKINTPFTIRKYQIGFAPGVNRLLQIKIFVSPDPTAPTTGEPTGTNVFAQFAAQPYIIGDDALVEVEDDTYVPQRGMWLKVYAKNLDSFDHDVDVRVTIDIHYPQGE